jgi:hypothetical protein
LLDTFFNAKEKKVVKRELTRRGINKERKQVVEMFIKFGQ